MTRVAVNNKQFTDKLKSLLQNPASHSPRALAWGSELAWNLGTVLTVSEGLRCFNLNR